jgi:site-specific DNA recombinase
MLKNRIYRGEIVHKGKASPGEHAAIVDEDLWRRVQGHLEENRMERREGDKALEPSLLTGIVFDAGSEPMTPTHAVKKGTRYRYYISRRLITGSATDSFRGQRVPASNLESLVIGRLRALLADPVEILNAISSGERDAPMQKRLRDAAAALSARWEHLPIRARHDFARSILVRAQIHMDRINLDIGSARLVSWLLNDGACEGVVEPHRASNASADGSEAPLIGLSIPASLKRTGKEMKFIVGGVAGSAPADTTLIRLLVRGQKIAKQMFGPNCPPLEYIAREEKITASYATRLVRLTFLAPDIVAAILAGKQPAGLTANKLMADTRLPLDWRDQRAALGFA